MLLKEGNIRLRAIEPSDATIVYQWENDPAIWSVSERLAPLSSFEIEQFILNSQDIFGARQLRLMIDYYADGTEETIGTSDIYDFDPYHLRAGIGIFIDSKHRNNGFARIAIRLTEEYCFEILGLHQIYCLIAANNQASLKLFESLNYRKTGCKTEWIKTGDIFIDQLQYQLNKTDFKQRKG
jgi:diamine N-acetyltransferase